MNKCTNDSADIRNNREDWIVVYDKMDFKTFCHLCLSNMEVDKESGITVINMILDFGYLAEKGLIYILIRNEYGWNLIAKRGHWVS